MQQTIARKGSDLPHFHRYNEILSPPAEVRRGGVAPRTKPRYSVLHADSLQRSATFGVQNIINYCEYNFESTDDVVTFDAFANELFGGSGNSGAAIRLLAKRLPPLDCAGREIENADPHDAGEETGCRGSGKGRFEETKKWQDWQQRWLRRGTKISKKKN